MMKAILSWLKTDQLIHAGKTVLACLIGYAVTHLIGAPAGQWIVMSILVVMCAQLYVGSVFGKAYFRFLGTIVGCTFATLTLLILGASPVAIAIGISISAFVFSYVATSTETISLAATLGAVTTTVILLGQHPTLEFAFMRFFEISLGILIASLVSQFIFPINARTQLQHMQSVTLKQLGEYYQLVTNKGSKQDQEIDYVEIDENVAKFLSKQRQLAKESAREPLGPAFDAKHYGNTLFCERQMLRTTTMMRAALDQLPEPETILSMPEFQAFNNSVIETISYLTKVISPEETRNAPIKRLPIEKMKYALRKKLRLKNINDSIHLDGLLFAAEVFSTNLENLAILFQVQVLSNEDEI